MTHGCTIATTHISKNLVDVIQSGYNAAVTKFEHLKDVDSLQHWIDFYLAVAEEVQDINIMLREKYLLEKGGNYVDCRKRIIYFDAHYHSVLDKLERALPRKNRREMAKIVFDSIRDMSDGWCCCNDEDKPYDPTLEIKIISLPEILREKPKIITKEEQEALQKAEEAENRMINREREKIQSFLQSLQPIPPLETDDLHTVTPTRQPQRESRPKTSNMLGAAKRYASKSPDRHQSNGTSPDTPKGNRLAVPGKGKYFFLAINLLLNMFCFVLELENSVRKTRKEYEEFRKTETDRSRLLSESDMKDSSMVMSAFNHLQSTSTYGSSTSAYIII